MGAVTLVAMIITVLVSMNYKSIQSLKIAQMMSKSREIDTLKTINNEEKIYVLAVNQYCGTTAAGCFNETNVSDNNLSKTTINQYKPKTNNTINQSSMFNKIRIDQQSKAIIFEHTLKDNDAIVRYYNNSMSENKLSSCITGTLPNCQNNAIQTIYPISKINTIANINEELNLLNAKIDSGTLVGQGLSQTILRKNALTNANTSAANAKNDNELIANVITYLKNSNTKDYKTLEKDFY